jgi:hypothetical protein
MAAMLDGWMQASITSKRAMASIGHEKYAYTWKGAKGKKGGLHRSARSVYGTLKDMHESLMDTPEVRGAQTVR